MARIAVVGSMNIDLVVQSKRRPGAEVSMLGTVGDDEHGRYMLNTLKHENINTAHIQKCKGKESGVAVIQP